MSPENLDASPAPSAPAGVTHTTAGGPPRRVVLDAGGRAPLLPQARAAFVEALDQGWADPRRLHAEGRRARMLLDGAREAVASVVGARTEDVDLAPSHTAALHSAVLSVARGRRRAGGDVVVSAVERAAVLHAAESAAAASGGRRVEVPVGRDGRVDAARMVEAVGAAGVALVALQHANGEVGTLQPTAEVHEAARAAGVPLLVDAGASLGHVDIGSAWDVLAADPGDWGGPAGVGVLVTRPGVRRSPVVPQDEDRWFPGGVSVPAALAAAVALQVAVASRDAADVERRRLVDRVRARVAAEVVDTEVVGDPDARLPHVVTFSSLYVDGEALVTALDRLGFAVASGSACTSSSLEPSHVLAAMGVLTHGNVRLALPRGTDPADVDRFLDALPGVVAAVRSARGADGL
ncbi:cysteine desulfurase family protein [Cellulomonas fimi]|uniref:Aminotransferase class V n=1 Tax=Cellulomonas fimi (strain ATCC 484 / DSM 20113 / JCM 1341 / CCUG 24087 / LMG 16345 / NBRC 15513 / NCIMB 8980 / NCTC 7547 / NRS-133) TaxID=590998 RepID=F4H1M0_CELFA|nr:aminotransferase class V-fold PLP-dependent enzyme [Cellulomonas fimi]AEE46319.1 aminotransferase class V [Cellulomonas fimi ATCC 484]VEH32510.1 Cysteine desulfurase [Cellulomonas fimi]